MPNNDRLRLLDKDRLLVTGPLDKANWNYSPLLSLLQRARFRLVIQLIGTNQYENALEIGYGSGIFFPELKRRCARLFGVDIHQHADAVRTVLADVGVAAMLYSASAESMPIESGSMDLVISVSALEYVPDKSSATNEIHRILRPTGSLVVVYPLANTILDIGLKLLTGDSAAQYGDGRQKIFPALCEKFSIVRRIRFPRWLPLQIYEAALFTPRQ